MSYILTMAMCVMFGSCGIADVSISETVAAADQVKIETAVIQDDRVDRTYSLNMNGTVKAANINGSIKITTWDSPQVRLIAVKSSKNPEALKFVDVKVESTDSDFSVRVDYKKDDEYGDRKRRDMDDLKVEFELTVPSTAVLDGITTVNGDVSIAGPVGNTKATTVNGTVRATNLGGAATLTTVNGTVEADFDQLLQGSDINLTTVNGQVNLVLPSDANATIKATSLSGSIKNDFGLPVKKGEFVGRDMHGMIGSGDVKIKMSSVSGGLSVNRKNDGRQLSPATNLLDMKGDDVDYDKPY